MFGDSKSHLEGSAEVSDGPIYTTPRSWSEHRGWPFRRAEWPVTSQRENSSPFSKNEPSNHSGTLGNKDAQKSAGAGFVTLITLKHVLITLAFSSPIVAFALVLKVPDWYKFHDDYWVNTFTHCNFNGHFTPYDAPSISVWDKSGFFYITVAWGKMAFSTAKFIDIVWDVVVGRTGQALLAWATYKVSSQYLDKAMRESPVSYTTFESLAFVSPTLLRTCRLAGDLLTNRGWRARLIFIWIILSSLFVLSFSSLVNAMSGYSSNTYAVMQSYEGESVPYTDYQIVQFDIHDAWRIGEPGPVSIAVGNACTRMGVESDGEAEAYESNNYHRRDGSDEDDSDENDDDDDGPWEYVPSSCTMFWRTVDCKSHPLHHNNILIENQMSETLASTEVRKYPAPSLTTV